MRKIIHKISLFSKQTGRYFLAIDGFQCASALAYTTIISIVPFMVLAIGILSAFPPFRSYIKEINNFVVRHFIPSSADLLQKYLEEFAGQISRLSAANLLFTIVSAVFLLFTIESIFNDIWRVKKRRRGLYAFLLYWAILTLLPPLVGTAFAVSGFLFTLPRVSALLILIFQFKPVLFIISYFLTWVCFVFLYRTLPNTQVLLKHAALGATVSALIFELLKLAFGFYVANLSFFNDIYGSIAAIPIFLFWLYLSWLVIILGAVIAYVSAHPDIR